MVLLGDVRRSMHVRYDERHPEKRDRRFGASTVLNKTPPPRAGLALGRSKRYPARRRKREQMYKNHKNVRKRYWMRDHWPIIGLYAPSASLHAIQYPRRTRHAANSTGAAAAAHAPAPLPPRANKR